MKTTNILYWVFTILFAGLMLFSGIANTFMIAQSEPVFNAIGFPLYIIPFLGVAKMLGAIAIVVPGFPRIKEWAYAGLIYDLVGATYSNVQAVGFQLPMISLFVFILLGGLSYFFYHKRLKGALQ